MTLCLHFYIYENAAFVKGKPSAFPFASAGADPLGNSRREGKHGQGPGGP
jgi:hypothetical protein